MTFEGTTDIGAKTAAGPDSRLAAGFVAGALLPLIAVVAVAYLVTGVAMPVLPVSVHRGLGLGPPLATATTSCCRVTDALLTDTGCGVMR